MNSRAPKRGRALAGHTCNICTTIGDHFDDDCPEKQNVGVPGVLREQAVPGSAQLGGTPKVAPVASEPVVGKDPRELYKTATFPWGYLPGSELMPVVSSRPDVPPSLLCAAGGGEFMAAHLVSDPIWCQGCDTAWCSTCLGPADEPWVCGNCHASSPDNFHIVGALRRLAQEWAQCVVYKLDQHAWAAPS